MEPEPRGHSAPLASPLAGTFRPALPADSHDVVRLFAIAARSICAQPKALAAVGQALTGLTERLLAPDRTTAEECLRMWHLFARVAQLPKDTLRLEAARAFCRDLDSLGQKLDLAPLAEWSELPSGIDEPAYDAWIAHHADPAAGTAATGPQAKMLMEVVQEAQAWARENGPLKADVAARLLAVIAAEERQKLFQQMIGKGELGRSDANMLIRFLLKGGEVGPQDTMLREVLERLGRFLLR